MNRNFSLIFILFATISIVNAIPLHILHKRDVAFQECPKEVAPATLAVTMDPADPVPGGANTFNVAGKVPVEEGSTVVIGYFAEGQDAPIGKLTAVPVCGDQVKCPAEEFNLKVPDVPAPSQEEFTANPKMAIIVFSTAKDGKTPTGCAGGGVPAAPAGGDAPAGDAPPADDGAPPADAPPADDDAPPADAPPADDDAPPAK